MSIIYKNDLNDLNNCGVYIIKNLINNKQYIGSTNNFKKRLMSHNLDLQNKNHDNCYLQKAYIKQNGIGFVFIIKEICSNYLEKEQFYLDNEVFNDINHKEKYYNISEKANCPPSQKGKSLSESHKKKISEAQLGAKGNNYGKKHSIETIEKMRKIKLNKVQSLETKNKIKESHFGKKHKDSTKLKISASKKGKILSAETKEKMSLSKIGENHHTFKGLIYAENLNTLEIISAPNSKILSRLINCSPSAIDIRINEKSKKYTDTPIFKKWKIYRIRNYKK